MVEIIWTKRARLELDEIVAHIALDKPIAAKDFEETLVKAVRMLQQFPRAGNKIREFDEERFRELVVGPCRVFYLLDEKIIVVGVIRGEQLLRPSMLRI